MARGNKNLVTQERNLPANWEKQMAEDAARAVKQEASVSVGQFMSIRGGILQFQQTPVPGNKFQGVILASILENAYYTQEFDPQNPSSPDCYAFSDPTLDPELQEKRMAPHEQSPERQSAACADCQWNKFGTAEKGRGKACKNGRRMALIHVDDLKKNPKDWTVAFLKIPPTSLPGWASYVRSISDMTGRPPYAVATEVAVVPDTKSQYKVTFNLVKKIDDKKALASCFTKHNELEKSIGFPYQVIEAPQQQQSTRNRRQTAAAPNTAVRKGGKKAKKSAGRRDRPAAAQRQAPPPQAGGGSPFGGGGRQRAGSKF
jgi:hypothetical protein